MSTAHAAPAAGDHASHDAHAHDFDGEPAHALPADEPRTPGWLPALGIVFFVCAGVAFLVSSGGPSGEAAPANTAPAAAPPSPAAQNPTPPSPAQPAQAAPPADQAGAAAAQKLTPEQIKQIQQLLDQERAKRGVPNPAPAPAQ